MGYGWDVAISTLTGILRAILKEHFAESVRV